MYRFVTPATEDIHLLDFRVALINYICAMQRKDRFIVRIENSNRDKHIEEKSRYILNLLDTFGLKYNNVHYRSNNFKYHLQFASTLLDEKKAFICFCTKEDIERKRGDALKKGEVYNYDGTCENLSSDYILNNKEPFTIRIKKPTKDISVYDQLKGNLICKKENIDSFIIMNIDKYPTHNFASAIDDMLQGITDIIEDETRLQNRPKQEYIRKSLGYDTSITYAHIPTILDTDGKKLSKKDNINSLNWLLNQGYIPETIINYLLLLGNKTPKEIFTLDEAMEWFNLNSLSKSAVKFDINRLKYINREQIKLLSDNELAKRLGYSGKGIGKIAKLYANYESTTFEIKQKIDALFAPNRVENEHNKNIETIKIAIQKAPNFEKFDKLKKYLIEESGLDENLILEILKKLLTNSRDEPKIEHLYPLIKNYIKEVIK